MVSSTNKTDCLRKNGGRKIIRSAIDFAKITAKLSNNGKCLNI
jgi:hypothetical protein